MKEKVSLTYNKVYPYTNENLMGYRNLFDFENKDIASVLGSGDQYFSLKLFGAKDIVLFDINNTANFYFALKYYSIIVLSYEEFIEFFVKSKLDDLSLYNKVRDYLLEDVRFFFGSIIRNEDKLSSLIYNVSLNSSPINFSTDRVIPYFDRCQYYKLQSILRNAGYPKIYNVSLEDLYMVLDGKKYDLFFFSNIFLHLDLSVKKYRKLMDKYLTLLKTDGAIQADYLWLLDKKMQEDFIRSGFVLREVPSIRYVDEKSNFKDYVFTLKR